MVLTVYRLLNRGRKSAAENQVRLVQLYCTRVSLQGIIDSIQSTRVLEYHGTLNSDSTMVLYTWYLYLSTRVVLQ